STTIGIVLRSLRQRRSGDANVAQSHPEAQDIVSLAQDDLSEPAAREVREHLLWCDACSASYFRLLEAVRAEEFWSSLRAAVDGLRGAAQTQLAAAPSGA